MVYMASRRHLCSTRTQSIGMFQLLRKHASTLSSLSAPLASVTHPGHPDDGREVEMVCMTAPSC
jgi:hypothetical protein